MDPITLGIALKLATQFVPGIIKHFTNSDTAGTVAGQVIDLAKTVTGQTEPQAALEKLQVDPALAMQFQKDVMANETSLVIAFLGDTQNARQREVDLAKAGVRNVRANVMAASALLIVLIGLMIVVWSSQMDDYAKGLVTLVVGRALGWVEQVFSYEFGTTRSSQVKDATISNLTK